MLNARKVLIVVTEDWYFLSHRLSLAKKLRDEGADVSVACRIQQGRAEIEAENFTLIPLDIARESLSPRAALKTVFALRKIYNQVKPDVIIHVALLTVLLGSIAGFLTSRKTQINMLTGMGFLFIADKLKNRLIRQIIKVFFYGLSVTRNRHIIVQNTDDQKLLQTMGFKINKNLHLIRGSGVDADVFYPASKEPDLPSVTFVGRMLWAKGILELIEAKRLLSQAGKKFRLILVGDPDPGNPQSASQADLEAWEKEGLVECWGRRRDIADIYRQSTIAILPSWREGLPKSLLEAAACGLPMIASDVAGCREIVRPHENGILVPLRNPKALATAIETLLDNPSMRQEFGANARKLVDEELNEHAITDQTVSLIQRSLIKLS